MRIGFVASSGGSVFAETVRILEQATPRGKYEYHVVTDRPCGIESFCTAHGINQSRIEDPDNTIFSAKATAFFDDCSGVDVVLLFSLRLVTKELFMNYATFNIHPSLLPAFKGFNPISNALKKGVRFIGATLHVVDNSVDGGPIISQVCMPINPNCTEEMLNKFSFVQKVYLSLLLVELIETNSLKLANDNSNFEFCKELPFTDRCNPSLRNQEFLSAVLRLQSREQIEVIR